MSGIMLWKEWALLRRNSTLVQVDGVAMGRGTEAGRLGDSAQASTDSQPLNTEIWQCRSGFAEGKCSKPIVIIDESNKNLALFEKNENQSDKAISVRKVC